MCHMNANLMRSTSFWIEFYDWPFFRTYSLCDSKYFRRWNNPILSLCWVSFVINNHLGFIGSTCIDTENWGINNSRCWKRFSRYEGVVGFFYFSRTKLFCHMFVAFSREASDDDTRGFSINAVGEGGMVKCSRWFPSFRKQVDFYLFDKWYFIGFMVWAMDNQSCRFIVNKYFAIFVENSRSIERTGGIDNSFFLFLPFF